MLLFERNGHLKTASEVALAGGPEKRPASVLPFARPRPDINSIGFHGLNRYRGLISEEYVTDLRGSRKIDLYQKMASDGLIQAMLLAVELPVIAASWVIEPASQSPNALRAAELVEDQLFNRLGCCWEDEVQKFLSYLHFGFLVCAKQWRIENGTAVLSELRDLHPKTILQGGKNWDFDDAGQVIGAWQYGNTGTTFREEYIPGHAMFLLTNRGRFGNPEGVSLLRAGYKHWLIKDQLYRIDAIGKERGAIGTPVGRYPEGTSQADQNKLEDFCRYVAAHENGYGIFPEGITIENFSVDTKTEEIIASIQHHNSMLAMSVLAQFLLLGQEGKGGAYALSADQTDLFMLSLEAVADYLSARLNRGVIREMVDFNLATDEYPRLSATISRQSAGSIANAVRSLTAGTAPVLTVDDGLEDYLRELLQLPPRAQPRPAPAAGESEPAAVAEEEPNGPEQMRARRELIVLQDPPSFREEPAYLALGQAADQFHAQLVQDLAVLRERVWRLARLPEEEQFSRGRTFKRQEPLTPEQRRELDLALQRFLTRLFGETLTAAAFAGTDTEDALVGEHLRLGHAVGVNRSRELSGRELAAFQPTRDSPEIRALLERSFERLSKNGERRLLPWLDDIREIIEQGAVDGRTGFEVAKDLSARFEQYSRYEFERLARTEMSFAAGHGQVDEFRAQGVRFFVPVISALACPVCQAHKGARIPVEDARPGENLPPYHPQCMDSIAAGEDEG